ncbi:hypothetical protein PIB30_002295 [Stylosanthes scabra]|uniref:Protein kinase domain-containing protein n=1 Tax=Stylosanthes scabra TaxID=79078 RepID=A0ABU6U1T3_9FABA|nr:hypothetical protein [Stylosanthes scabra]
MWYNSVAVVAVVAVAGVLCMCEGKKELCGGHRCGNGPPIRFPFRLKDKEPTECGYPYPGFDLTCDHHDTIFEMSFSETASIKFVVDSIDYEMEILRVSYPESCLRGRLLELFKTNASFSPFPLPDNDQDPRPVSVSFFSCSPDPQYPFSCPIFVAGESSTLIDDNLVSCTKVLDASSSFDFDTGSETININQLHLSWSKPSCSSCELSGKLCRLANNNNGPIKVECYEKTTHLNPIIKILMYITGGAFESLLLLLAVVFFFKTYRYFRTKGEDQARIRKFLEDYRALKPTRFSYNDIKRITNGFKDKLGEGAHGAVFKGKLSSNIIVAVKVLNNAIEGEGKDFINEVGTMGKIHHVNVVRLLGFCAQGFHRALVYDFFPRGSLHNFLSTPDNDDIFLGWEKLHQIALSIARGIEYLHHGCEHQILHFDINPHNILLDDRFTPKITDFGLAKLCSKDKSAVSMTAARGTLGYIAPEVVSRNFGTVTYKADIYSYGMLLLEMVGGRKNMEATGEGASHHILYPEWVHNLVDGGDVHVPVEDENDIKIAKKIAIVGLWCIQWHPSNRPSIKTVVKMLEGDADKLTVPSNPFNSTNSVSGGKGLVTSSRCLNLELEVIRE